MKVADLKALPHGTELFHCTNNGWNKGRGQSGSLVTVYDATVGHWLRSDTGEWARRTRPVKYGRFNQGRTTHGILMQDAQGRIFVATTGHIRGLYSKCMAELQALRETNARIDNARNAESDRQETMRNVILDEFGLRVTGGYAGYGVPKTSCVVDTAELINLLRELAHAAQQ